MTHYPELIKLCLCHFYCYKITNEGSLDKTDKNVGTRLVRDVMKLQIKVIHSLIHKVIFVNSFQFIHGY